MRYLLLFHRFVLRDLIQNRTRSLLTVAGVALGIAVVVAVHLANNDAIDAFRQNLEVLNGKADFQIEANGLPLDEMLISRLSWLWDYGSMSAIVEGRGILADDPRTTVRIIGIDLLADGAFRDYWLKDNRNLAGDIAQQEFIELLQDPQLLILPESLAERYEWNRGSSIGVVIGDERKQFRAGAMLRNGGIAAAFAGNVFFMDIAAAQLALDRIGTVDRIDVLLNDRANLQQIESRIRAQLPANAVITQADDSASRNEKMLRAFRYNLTALSYIALIVGVILIYNTLMMASVRRSREIAILRTLGAGRWTVAALFLAEAMLLGALGGVLGVWLGEVLSTSAGAVVTGTIETLYTGVHLNLSGNSPDRVFYLLVFVLAVSLSAVAGLAPALRATTAAPVSVLRQGAMTLKQALPALLRRKRDEGETAGTMQRGKGRRASSVAAIVLLLSALLLSFGPPLAGFPFLGYGAAICLIAGFSFAAPAMAGMVLSLFAGIVYRLFPVEGRLAYQGIAAGLHRVVVAVISLSIAVAMLVSVATMVGSFRDTVVVWVNETLRADLYLRPAAAGANDWVSALDSAAVEAIAQRPEVAAVDRFRGREIEFNGSRITLAGGEFATLKDHGDLLFTDGRSIEDVADRVIGHNRVIVSEPFSIRQNLHRGDSILLPAPDGNHAVEIEAVFYDYSNDRGLVVMDRSTYIELFKDTSINNVAVYLRPGVNSEAARSSIAAALPSAQMRISLNRELRDQVLRVFDRTFQVTYALEAIAVVVAVLGIANILAANILERRPELGMLRFVGTGHAQIVRIILIESGMAGVVGIVLGCLLGLLLSFLLIFVINKQSFGWTIQFAIPAGFLIQALSLVLVATCVAGLYPAALAMRGDPIQSVRAE